MKNENCISVYVPDSLENNNVGYLTGFIQKDGAQVKFYITDDKLSDVWTGCIGYCGLAHVEGSHERPNYWIRVSFSGGHFQVSHILCHGVQEYKLIYIFYDYKTFKRSNIVNIAQRNKDDFFYLSSCLSSNNNIEEILPRKKSYHIITEWFLSTGCQICAYLRKNVRSIAYSSTFLHLESNLLQAKFLLHESYRSHKLSIAARNLILCCVLDLGIGLTILWWLLQYHDQLVQLVVQCTDNVIQQIGALLKMLMGSPIGLKLNNAFNQTLGSFFLYHMSLWNTFLLVTSPILRLLGMLACWLATAGFSYQIALVADVFALTTFHVHCIYVYAARLYGVQLHGLVALWRLFLGRKRNPLKCRVDTYRYNSHQLFIGTLTFSILLFLLPTTALYYLVFVTLRLLLISVAIILDRLRMAVREPPLYTTLLWLVNSPEIRDDVHVTIRPTAGALTVHATVHAGTWLQCCKSLQQRPLPLLHNTQHNIPQDIFSTILYGNLI